VAVAPDAGRPAPNGAAGEVLAVALLAVATGAERDGTADKMGADNGISGFAPTDSIGRSRAPELAIPSPVGCRSREKAIPKKTTIIAMPTNAMQARCSKIPTSRPNLPPQRREVGSGGALRARLYRFQYRRFQANRRAGAR